MNVILFTSAANTSGGSRQALYLARGLADSGHSVRFFIPARSDLPGLATGAPFWRPFNDARDWRKDIEAAMREMAQNGNPTVVHAFHNAAVKRAAWWGLFWKKRALVVAHRGVIFRPNNPLPYWSPGVDAFLVNSMACAKVLRGIGLSSKRLFYVPNCVPDSRLAAPLPSGALRSALGMAPDAPVFLCIGGNKPYKGVKELLHAFAQAFPPTTGASPGTGPHLVILGVTPALWQPLVEQLGQSGRAHCLERSEDVGSYLATATAFVLPSLSESMPNTLLEAVRAGLPCIGTHVGAVPDILGSASVCRDTSSDLLLAMGQGHKSPPSSSKASSSSSDSKLRLYCRESPCGLVVPPGDVPALAAAMRRVADEPGLRASLAAAALKQGDAYTPEKRIALVESIYTQLLHKKGLL